MVRTPIQWQELADKMSADIVSDNSFPIEWYGRTDWEHEDATAWLAACLVKYLPRYFEEQSSATQSQNK